MSDKPREWTLVFDHDNQTGEIRTRNKYNKRDRHDEHVDVIEYSAYQSLLELNKELLEELMRCEYDMKYICNQPNISKKIGYTLAKARAQMGEK